MSNILFLGFALLVCVGMTSLATFLNRNLSETAKQIENYVRDTLTARDRIIWNVDGNELEVLKFLAKCLEINKDYLRPTDSFRFIFFGNHTPNKKGRYKNIMPGFYGEIYYKIDEKFDLKAAYKEGIGYMNEDLMIAILLEMNLEEFIRTFGRFYKKS